MGADSDEVAIRVDLDGIMVLMTRHALEKLSNDLNRILTADPAEAFHTHLGMLFSSFSDDGAYRTPSVSFSDALGVYISKTREENLRRAIEAGEVEADAQVTPFEITFMHVSADALAEAKSQAEDQD